MAFPFIVPQDLDNADKCSSSPKTFRGSGRQAESEMRVRSGPIPLSRMEVSIRTERERYPASQISGASSFVSTNPQEHCKTHEVTYDVDVESGTGMEQK
jgi:hypothetical protein